MAKCSKCGKLVLGDIKFCPDCGGKIKKIEPKSIEKVGMFYKINYSLISLFVWLISVVTFVLILLKPDNQIRFESFFPYLILFVIIGLIVSVMHLILRKKDQYTFKGKVLAIVLIILLILTFVVPVMITGRIEDFTRAAGCYKEYKYYSGCNREMDFRCAHYSMIGFGDCDACEKTICPNR